MVTTLGPRAAPLDSPPGPVGHSSSKSQHNDIEDPHWEGAQAGWGSPTPIGFWAAWVWFASNESVAIGPDIASWPDLGLHKLDLLQSQCAPLTSPSTATPGGHAGVAAFFTSLQFRFGVPPGPWEGL